MGHTFSVTVAPNGARRGKADHPALPVTTDEIARTAAKCYDAGAQAIHLHVRDEAGQHSLDAGRYREAISAIHNAAPDMAIQVTTESAGLYEVESQYDCLRQLTPDAASVSIREMARNEAIAKHLYAFCAEAQTQVQHILYNQSDISQLRSWVKQGVVPKTMRSAIFVLGQYSPPVHGRPEDLQHFLDASIDLNLDWTICTFGPNELACARAALQAGGNLRVGFENNLLMPDGSPARDNAEIVALTVNEGRKLGLELISDLPKAS